eukprot:sb/3466945/
MFYRKRGYIILDCNATSVDLQAIIFALEFSSVLCITVSGTERVTLDNAYCQVLRTTSLIGRFDIPVIKQGRGAHRAGHQIAKICEQFPHKVTIVCLGPLTNIADALKCSNTFHKKVKRIVFAAGGFSGRQFTCHHNIESDSEACRSVFRSSLPIVLIPEDCFVPLIPYLAMREGTCGLFTLLFDANDEKLLSASQQVGPRDVPLALQCHIITHYKYTFLFLQANPGHVCLTKVALVLVALNAGTILKRDYMSFGVDKTATATDLTEITERSENVTCNTDSTLGLRARPENVLVVRSIDRAAILKFYRHLYLSGLY